MADDDENTLDETGEDARTLPLAETHALVTFGPVRFNDVRFCLQIPLRVNDEEEEGGDLEPRDWE